MIISRVLDVTSHPSFDAHEQVVLFKDPELRLQAMIAVHNTHLGPSLGGCRIYPYSSFDAALTDVLRLSRGMTYKSALAGLPPAPGPLPGAPPLGPCCLSPGGPPAPRGP